VVHARELFVITINPPPTVSPKIQRSTADLVRLIPPLSRSRTHRTRLLWQRHVSAGSRDSSVAIGTVVRIRAAAATKLLDAPLEPYSLQLVHSKAL
jgi:hypothetical protein